jgi:hypothetical protein
VHNYSSQVIKMTILSTQSRPGDAAHSERGHVERFHRKIHLRVHLRAIGIAPPKSFNVKAQHLERTNKDFRVFGLCVCSCKLYRSKRVSPLRMRSAIRRNWDTVKKSINVEEGGAHETQNQISE